MTRKRLDSHFRADLDSAKSQADRNRLGQYATPTVLATQILQYVKTRLSRKITIRFLDPAFGTGSFYSALLKAFDSRSIDRAAGYEIDPHYSEPSKAFWHNAPLQLTQADFTALPAPSDENSRFNLVICNPPYVRHHHIPNVDKLRLRLRASNASNIRLNGLAGLYCYFIALSHPWMADDALAAWLVPSEFIDVNYGSALKDYLLTRVSLLRIHRFDPDSVQFDDALVSSAVLFFRNRPPREGHSVFFTYGGSLIRPVVKRRIPARDLWKQAKWTRYPHAEPGLPRKSGITLGELFNIKRGIATGGNSFFILNDQQLAERGLCPGRGYTRPILPSPRYVEVSEINATKDGYPCLDRKLHLIDCRVTEPQVAATWPELARYFDSADHVAGRYLCQHRKPWYARKAAPFADRMHIYGPWKCQQKTTIPLHIEPLPGNGNQCLPDALSQAISETTNHLPSSLASRRLELS